MRGRVLAGLVAAAALAGCGVKAPPRPPAREPGTATPISTSTSTATPTPTAAPAAPAPQP